MRAGTFILLTDLGLGPKREILVSSESRRLEWARRDRLVKLGAIFGFIEDARQQWDPPTYQIMLALLHTDRAEVEKFLDDEARKRLVDLPEIPF